jgi:signal transduction histidine kinase
MNDCIVPEGKEREAEPLDERVAAGDRVAVEVRRETADGVRDFRFRNIAVETDERGPDGYAVYVDITDQKEREHRLQRQNERLEEFASVVSHDLRNPMGAVKHRIEMARQTGDNDHLADALGALDRMDDRLRELLQLARQGETVGQTEPVSLPAVAREAWNHVPTDDATLDVATDAVVDADRGRLTQLLENLYINAVEHGGRDEGALPSVTVGVDGDGCLYVADDGCGIPVEKREEVFSSGYTTGRNGTGYGLTIVKQVARAHGWEVGVAESHDGGARFEFRGVEFHER